MNPGWMFILPQIFLAAGGFIVFCVGAFWKNRSSGFLFGTALISVILAGGATIVTASGPSPFAGLVEGAGYGRYFTFIVTLITGVTLLFARQYAKSRGFARDEFYGPILLAALGMTLVASALHWLVFFLGLETLSVSLYVLIAIRKDETSSNEAGLKYFIMGVVASAFLTFGIAMVYAGTGKLNIAQTLAGDLQAANTPLVFLGLGLILVGIAFKISLVPFHLWTPDVYQGAPAPVTAFLTTGSKVALFAALLRLACYSGNDVWAHFFPVLWILAILSMIAGNIAALTQIHLKRLLAYSSIAQMGYLLMALLAVKQNSAPAVIFYLSVYALMDLGAFGSITILSEKTSDLDSLEDYKGLGYSHPWQAALLTLCLFSLAGLPPTGGFIGKFALFQAILQARFVGVAIVGILAVVVSIYFYLKVIVLLYMRPVNRCISPFGVTLSNCLAGGLILILILGLGILPSPLFAIIARIATSLSAPL